MAAIVVRMNRVGLCFNWGLRWGLQVAVVVASLVAFWPWIPLLQQPSPLFVDMNEARVAVASLALLFPLLLDWAVEIVGRFVAADIGATKVDNSLQHVSLNDCEKATLFVGLALGPAVVLASPDGYADDVGLLYLTMMRCQLVAVVGTLWASLHRMDPALWSLWSAMLGVTVMAVAVNMGYGRQEVHGPGADVAFYVMLAVAILGLLVPATRWLLRTVPTMMREKWDDKENFDPTLDVDGTTKELDPSRLVFPALHVVIGTASSLAILLMVATVGPNHPHTAVIFLVSFTAVEVALLVHVTLSKLELLYHLAAILQEKKDFMRYTAHQIRTPLNAAMLGVKLIVTALNNMDIRDEFDNELLDNANDVFKTLDIAVQILSNLMTWNKIEADMMVLHREKVPVLDYVNGCVEMFVAEARERHIEIVVVNEQTFVHAGGSRSFRMMGSLRLIRNQNSRVAPSGAEPAHGDLYEVLPSDSILADKSKVVEQVLRNLLSNALKFSKERSTIMVHVNFKPVKPTAESCRGVGPRPFMSSKSIFSKSIKSAKRRVAAASSRFLNTNGMATNRRSNVITGAGSVRGGRQSDVDNEDAKWVKGHLILRVVDTGVGISKENQRLLFRDGQQFDPHKLQGGGGSGFGLFISKSFALLHGGRIKAYSKGEGQGTSFTFTIPMRRTAVSMGRATMQGTRANGTPHGGGSNATSRRHVVQSAPVQETSTYPPAVEISSPRLVEGSSKSRKAAAANLARSRRLLGPKYVGDVVGDWSGSPLDHSVPPSMAPCQSPSHRCPSPTLSGAMAEAARGGEVLIDARPTSHAASATGSLEVAPPADALAARTGGTHAVDTAALLAEIARLRAALAAVATEPDADPLSVSASSTGLRPPVAGGGPGSFSEPFPSPRNHHRAGRKPEARGDDAAPASAAGVESLGGGVRRISAPRMSTTTPPRQPSPRSADRSQHSSKVMAGKQYYVLVVDDSAMSRKMMVKTLKADGHTCEEAADGKLAVDKVKADLDKFHAILMDFVMPVMDGPDATKAIRDLGYTRPVIGCTGNTLEMDLKRFRASGCNGVLGKPFVLDLFYQYMEEPYDGCRPGTLGGGSPHMVPEAASGGGKGTGTGTGTGAGTGEVRQPTAVVELARQWGLVGGGNKGRSTGSLVGAAW